VRPTSIDEVLDLLEAASTSAALGAALELKLFWMLDRKPVDATGVAAALGIPPVRCRAWLQVLRRAGLVDEVDGAYRPSGVARAAIIERYSQPTWALLAAEARERLPSLLELPTSLRALSTAPVPPSPEATDYVVRMDEDPEQARSFTRLLFELHGPLAEALAGFVDASGAHRMMDLGGGSGVVAAAFLRRYPGLSATVVDIPGVCAAGRELTAGLGLGDRLDFHAADFLRDELPGGFDVILECDVNVYGVELLRKLRAALAPGGRLVIADQMAAAADVAHDTRAHWAFGRSLTDIEFAGYPTWIEVRAQLGAAGFRIRSERPLPPVGDEATRLWEGTVVLEADA
jgi:SAM-dependent methyltransferase